MSFDDGLILGLSMGGSDDYKNRDPDFALYKAMEEPAANQIKALVRVTAKGSEREMMFITPYSSVNDLSADQEGLVDWGDGTSEGLGTSLGHNHTYGNAGDYIITITDYTGNYDYYRFQNNDGTNSKQAYLIALKVGKDLVYADGNGDMPYISSNFKYMQFGSGYVLGGYFRIWGCKRLTEIDILDNSVKPKVLPNNMFNSCPALDFRNIMPLLSEVENVGDSAFSYCYALQKLVLPKCTRMGSSTVSNCFTLTHVNLPECLEIGSSSLCYNDALREVNLPKCKTIGDSCFNSCYILNKITIPDDCSIGNDSMKSNHCLIPTPNGIYP